MSDVVKGLNPADFAQLQSLYETLKDVTPIKNDVVDVFLRVKHDKATNADVIGTSERSFKRIFQTGYNIETIADKLLVLHADCSKAQLESLDKGGKDKLVEILQHVLDKTKVDLEKAKKAGFFTRLFSIGKGEGLLENRRKSLESIIKLINMPIQDVKAAETRVIEKANTVKGTKDAIGAFCKEKVNDIKQAMGEIAKLEADLNKAESEFSSEIESTSKLYNQDDLTNIEDYKNNRERMYKAVSTSLSVAKADIASFRERLNSSIEVVIRGEKHILTISEALEQAQRAENEAKAKVDELKSKLLLEEVSAGGVEDYGRVLSNLLGDVDAIKDAIVKKGGADVNRAQGYALNVRSTCEEGLKVFRALNNFVNLKGCLNEVLDCKCRGTLDSGVQNDLKASINVLLDRKDKDIQSIIDSLEGDAAAEIQHRANSFSIARKIETKSDEFVRANKIMLFMELEKVNDIQQLKKMDLPKFSEWINYDDAQLFELVKMGVPLLRKFGEHTFLIDDAVAAFRGKGYTFKA